MASVGSGIMNFFCLNNVTLFMYAKIDPNLFLWEDLWKRYSPCAIDVFLCVCVCFTYKRNSAIKLDFV